MLTQQTIEKLKNLGYMGMAEEFVRHEQQPNVQRLSFEERFGLLVDAQTHYVEQRRYLRMMKTAKLKQPDACIENIDYRSTRGLDKGALQSLFRCKWLENHQHIVITGSTGNGKSYLGCAFAQLAIREGYSTLFYRFPRLLEDLATSRLDGSLPKLRTRLSRFANLVVDDWALSPLTNNSKQDLLEIIEDRTGSGSLVITSQLPLDKWHDYIDEPTYADAIMDRIVHRAHTIELAGDSMRKLLSPLTNTKRRTSK